jgi:hypothetical protein
MNTMLVFSYFGPETMLPMTSLIAAVVGFVMMFGRNAFRLAVRCVQSVIPGKRRPSIPLKRPYSGPHRPSHEAMARQGHQRYNPSDEASTVEH